MAIYNVTINKIKLLVFADFYFLVPGFSSLFIVPCVALLNCWNELRQNVVYLQGVKVI